MSGTKEFISGNEAVALAVRLARPNVVPAYPISPQTIVVEKLSEYIDDGSLDAKFIRVESEHSAITASLGASVMGARVFTATSSQGFLYMIEGMPFVSGGRYPVVMMNANRTVAVPWSIFCDHNDSLMALNSGWMQCYVEDGQEALDMTLQAFRIAEDPSVSTPIIINLDGFVLTHTYELVKVPSQKQVDEFLPPYVTTHKMDIDKPVATCIGAGPDWQTEFRYKQHTEMFVNATEVIKKSDAEFNAIFGRSYGNLAEKYRCEDAEAVLVAMGSVSTTVRTVVDAMWQDGYKVGMVRVRFLRPFPLDDFIALGEHVRAVGVIDRNVSYGYEGVVFSNVNSALSRRSRMPLTKDYIGGLAGRDITQENIRNMFLELLGMTAQNAGDRVEFINLRWNKQ